MIEELINSNSSDKSSNNETFPQTFYEENKATFWVCSVFYVCIAFVAVTGNGLVIYAAHVDKNLGRLRNFDIVIKSLAVTDMLFGLVGMPCRIIGSYYVGMYNNWLYEMEEIMILFKYSYQSPVKSNYVFRYNH